MCFPFFTGSVEQVLAMVLYYAYVGVLGILRAVMPKHTEQSYPSVW